MSLETLIALRSMILEFGAPMHYWSAEQLETFSELEREILVKRNSK